MRGHLHGAAAAGAVVGTEPQTFIAMM
jgi:hypothetical protein